MDSFPAHGSYEATLEGQVLIAHCRGSWNIEMHRAQSLQSRRLVEVLQARGPWATVVVLHDTLVTSVEVLQAGRDAVALLPEAQRPRALAWVIPPTIEGHDLLLERYAQLYADLLPTRVFELPAPALAWVEARLTGSG